MPSHSCLLWGEAGLKEHPYSLVGGGPGIMGALDWGAELQKQVKAERGQQPLVSPCWPGHTPKSVCAVPHIHAKMPPRGH